MRRIQIASPPNLSPIDEENNSSPSPLFPNAWQCCNCNLLNYFFDANHAWYTHTPEYCTSLSCLHERCPTCFDPGPILWPIQYADNRPILHLVAELQASFERMEALELETATAEAEAKAAAEAAAEMDRLIAEGNGTFLGDDSEGSTTADDYGASSSSSKRNNNNGDESADEEGEEEREKEEETDGSIISDEDHWLEILGYVRDSSSSSSLLPPLLPQLPAQISQLYSNDFLAIGTTSGSASGNASATAGETSGSTSAPGTGAAGPSAGRVREERATVWYPCPLRTTRFCEARFATQALAWRHSAAHTGQERVKCARRGCPMVFLGKEAMRLHFVGRHC